MSAHLAYCSLPNGDYGVLTADTFSPLTLHGVAVDVDLLGNCARVHVQYEYLNLTGRTTRAIAAYALPAHWDLMSCRAQYAGDSVAASPVPAAPTRLPAAAGPPAAFGALGAIEAIGGAAALRAAAQPLPWALSPGAALVVAASYHVPLDATRRRGEVRVALPADLFPPPTPPPSAAEPFAAAFDPRRPRALAAGWAVEARGDLFVPLAGPVALAPAAVGGAAEVRYIGDSAFRLRCAGPLVRAPREGLALECRVRETGEPLRFFLARDEGAALDDADRYAVALSLTPQLEGRRGCEANAEIIFVVDAHSRGNMAKAAGAIRTALRGLPNTTRANIVLTSNATQNANGVCAVFPSTTVPVADAPVEQIALIVESAALSPRGTCTLSAMLRAAAEQRPPCLCGPIARGYVRHIILMSDAGDAARGPEIVAFAAHTRCAGNVSFSAIALLDGGAANVPLLELIAAEGGGAFRAAGETQTNNNNNKNNNDNDNAVAAALVDVCARVAVPTLTDITIAFDESSEGLRVASGPRLAAIAKGSQRFIYGLAPASLASIGVTVTGRVGETMIEHVGRGNMQDAILQAAAETNNAQSIGLLHLSAAAARLRWLVESVQRTNAEAEEKEVARLAGSFMLLAPAMQMRQRRANAEQGNEKREEDVCVAVQFVPRNAAYARAMQQRQRERIAGGFVDRRPMGFHSPPLQLRPRVPEESPQGEGPPGTGVSGVSGVGVGAGVGKKKEGEAAAEAIGRRVALAALVPPQPTREFIRAIVSAIVDAVVAPPNTARLGALQYADGSFPLNATLATCVGITLERLERDVQLVGFGVSEDLTAGKEYLKEHERVWATAVAAAAMERDNSGVTALAYNKALGYMTVHDVGGTLIRHAHDVLDTTGQTTAKSSVAV